MNYSTFHIAHITSVHQVEDLRIFFKEARYLAKSGFQISLIAQSDYETKKDGVHINALKPFTGRWQRILLLFDIWRKVYEKRPEMVHLHDPELLLLAPFFKLINRIYIVFDSHESVVNDILSKYWLPFWLRPLIAVLYSWFQRLMLHWVDGLVVVSERSLTEHIGFPAEKIVLVKNFPVFTEKKSFENERIPGQIIFVGRPTPIRGVEEMIRSIKLLHHQETRLEIIGPIDPAYFKYLSRLVKTTQLQNRVYLRPTTDQGEIAKSLKKAQIALALNYPVPNHTDGIPTKVFTYMMNSIPIVASNIPLWIKLIDKHNCGITVDPYNPHQVAAAIDRLFEDPKLRQIMGENGYHAVKNFYNWDSEFKKLLKFYEQILEI